MARFGVVFLLCMIVAAARADDCLDYKLRPRVTIDVPAWQKEVVQPLQHMDLLHGDVIATLVDNYDITGDVTSIEDGFCVALKAVDATVGYTDFLVQIDIRHVPESCSYNAILSHEDEHIRAYLSIMDEYKAAFQSAIFSAADSIMPVFVQDAADIDSALDSLNAQLQSHPDLVLVKQKLKADEEIKNKHVDLRDDGTALRRCFE